MIDIEASDATLNDLDGSDVCSTMQQVALAEALDIRGASELAFQLRHALSTGKPIVLRASDVQRVDTASLQLLLAFFRQSQADGVSVTWQNPSSILCESAKVLGIGEALGLTQTS